MSDEFTGLSERDLAERAHRTWRRIAHNEPFLMWHLSQLCGVGRPLVVAGDPITTAACAGKREVWDHIATLAQLSPERTVYLDPALDAPFEE